MRAQMWNGKWVTKLGAFASASVLLCSQSAVAEDLLLQNVAIVSPELREPARNRHVLIRGERIVQISAKALAAPNAKRIDARGLYLTPGVMDSHVHVSTPPGLPLGADDPTLVALNAAYVRQQPRSYLYFGVTQVIDLAGVAEGVAAFEAQPLRPDLFRCGAAVVLNGYPMALFDTSVRLRVFPDYVFEPANAAAHPLPAGEDPAKHTPEAVVEAIAARGARCVKVFIEDGFGERSDWPLMSTATLKRVQAAARKHHLLLVAHANAIDMQRMAVALPVDVLAHGLWNWNEYRAKEGVPEAIAQHLRLIHTRKIGLQPTLRVLPGIADLFRADTLQDPVYAKVVPPALLAWYGSEAGQWFKREMQRDFGGAPDAKIAQVNLSTNDQNMRSVRFLNKLGHPLLLGSDTPSAPTYGNQPGYDTYREMRSMAQAGVPLRAILEAATLNNARQFGLEKDYGTVEAGKIANLLLLKTNPLESVQAWADIERVILHGRVIERETLAADH
ncbi:amidohydrolase family protein [Hyalangium rubrum]|uniref:Amidohydrolase family protein n=1 Tax=Hyalangium rubrum TaxID=3103134 RepID=A0ABU5H2P0_9BACT|nr:amidohydrolase family protein [Hyalangium sp. s54d21]MDY7227377.1 amidohydrolase family protein [Hyalangium sp. s54d21]